MLATGLLVEDVSALLVCSVRYALGRRTYLVSDVCRMVHAYRHLLHANDRAVMIRDIREQEPRGYGDPCDRDDWLKLLAILESRGASDE